jgi:late competence protein required for DNA uptake (superfamily II DNA/RNA helicase)
VANPGLRGHWCSEEISAPAVQREAKPKTRRGAVSARRSEAVKPRGHNKQHCKSCSARVIKALCYFCPIMPKALKNTLFCGKISQEGEHQDIPPIIQKIIFCTNCIKLFRVREKKQHYYVQLYKKYFCKPVRAVNWLTQTPKGEFFKDFRRRLLTIAVGSDIMHTQAYVANV